MLNRELDIFCSKKVYKTPHPNNFIKYPGDVRTWYNWEYVLLNRERPEIPVRARPAPPLPGGPGAPPIPPLPGAGLGRAAVAGGVVAGAGAAAGAIPPGRGLRPPPAPPGGAPGGPPVGPGGAPGGGREAPLREGVEERKEVEIERETKEGDGDMDIDEDAKPEGGEGDGDMELDPKLVELIGEDAAREFLAEEIDPSNFIKDNANREEIVLEDKKAGNNKEFGDIGAPTLLNPDPNNDFGGNVLEAKLNDIREGFNEAYDATTGFIGGAVGGLGNAVGNVLNAALLPAPLAGPFGDTNIDEKNALTGFNFITNINQEKYLDGKKNDLLKQVYYGYLNNKKFDDNIKIDNSKKEKQTKEFLQVLVDRIKNNIKLLPNIEDDRFIELVNNYKNSNKNSENTQKFKKEATKRLNDLKYFDGDDDFSSQLIEQSKKLVFLQDVAYLMRQEQKLPDIKDDRIIKLIDIYNSGNKDFENTQKFIKDASLILDDINFEYDRPNYKELEFDYENLPKLYLGGLEINNYLLKLLETEKDYVDDVLFSLERNDTVAAIIAFEGVISDIVLSGKNDLNKVGIYVSPKQLEEITQIKAKLYNKIPEDYRLVLLNTLEDYAQDYLKLNNIELNLKSLQKFLGTFKLETALVLKQFMASKKMPTDITEFITDKITTNNEKLREVVDMGAIEVLIENRYKIKFASEEIIVDALVDLFVTGQKDVDNKFKNIMKTNIYKSKLNPKEFKKDIFEYLDVSTFDFGIFNSFEFNYNELCDFLRRARDDSIIRLQFGKELQYPKLSKQQKLVYAQVYDRDHRAKAGKRVKTKEELVQEEIKRITENPPSPKPIPPKGPPPPDDDDDFKPIPPKGPPPAVINKSEINTNERANLFASLRKNNKSNLKPASKRTLTEKKPNAARSALINRRTAVAGNDESFDDSDDEDLFIEEFNKLVEINRTDSKPIKNLKRNYKKKKYSYENYELLQEELQKLQAEAKTVSNNFVKQLDDLQKLISGGITPIEEINKLKKLSPDKRDEKDEITNLLVKLYKSRTFRNTFKRYSDISDNEFFAKNPLYKNGVLLNNDELKKVNIADVINFLKAVRPPK